MQYVEGFMQLVVLVCELPLNLCLCMCIVTLEVWSCKNKGCMLPEFHVVLC